MAKVKPIPLGGEPGRHKIEIPDRMTVELASLAGKARQGLLAFAVGVGLQVFRTLLDEDVARIAGPKGRHDPAGRAAYRHGDQESSVTLGGRKVGIVRARVRGVAGGEVALPTWAVFAGEELLSDQTMTCLLAGSPPATTRRPWNRSATTFPPRRPRARPPPAASWPAPPRRSPSLWPKTSPGCRSVPSSPTGSRRATT